MSPQDLITGIKIGVVDQNDSIYRDLFSSTEVSSATDPYWKRALSFFESLDSEQKAIFFEIIRQVSVDTVSNTFGVLDGVICVEGVDADLRLLDRSGAKQNGDLQTLFLVDEEKGAELV